MGKIELDHTGSGGGVTLSSDGTDLLLDGTAIGGGGGGADLYAAETTGSTDPTASGTLSVAIGSNAVAAGENDIVFGAEADTNTAGFAIAMGYNARSLGVTGLAIGRDAKADSARSVAIGNGAHSYQTEATAIGRLATSAGAGAVALGNSKASGTDSFASVIDNNSSSYGATGANSVAMGYRAKGSSGKSTAIGGEQPLASGSNSFAAGGEFQTASGAYSVSLGGSVNTASGEAAYAFGKRALADKVGKYAFGAQLTGTSGATQAGMMVLIADTTDATAEALRSNTNAAGTTNQIVVPSNAAFAFHGTIVAKQSGSANAAAWKVEGLIVNNGGTTTLTNSATTVISNTPSWGMALSADDTNDALAITVTGAASTNIRWVATIHTSEVTYA